MDTARSPCLAGPLKCSVSKIDFINCPLISDLRGDLLDAQHHRESIVRAVAAFLSAGDGVNAFAFADRACRLALKPPARFLSLRAESLRVLGEHDDAETDLKAALEDDPSDPAVNEYILRSSSNLRQEAARTAVFDRCSGWDLIGLAAHVLFEDGCSVVSRISIDDRLLTGWAAWRIGRAAQLRIEHDLGQQSVQLKPELAHPLLSDDIGAAFLRLHLDAPISKVSFFVDDAEAENSALEISVTSPRSSKTRSDAPVYQSDPMRPRVVSVIIPIYAGVVETIACLTRVAGLEQPSFNIRTIIVDDCCPDRSLSERVERLCEEFGFEYVKNRQNLGFAGSVNVGLEIAAEGDVLILTSYCMLPSTCLNRLTEAAYQATDIGTVTPLSNDGAFTSFPFPFRENPLPADDLIDVSDSVAAQENGDAVVDIPTGSGFCLYVKRSVIESVGFLPTDYGRSYCVPADFCLRAREAGFRNVCAVGVFVGCHRNSSPDGAEKPFFAKNVKQLIARFPDHRAESAAFMKLDPLRAYREAMQSGLKIGGGSYLLVAMTSDPRDLALREIRWPAAEQETTRLTWSHSGNASLFGEKTGPILQERSWRAPDARETWRLALERLAPSRIGILDPFAFPEGLASLLLSIGAPIDLIMSASPFQPRLDGEISNCQLGEAGCEACFLAFESYVRRSQAERDEIRAWRNFFERAERIIPTNRLAAATAKRLLTPRSDQEVVDIPLPAYLARAQPAGGEMASTLGVIVDRPTIETDQFCLALAKRMDAIPEWRLVVLGECVDDLRLLSCPNVFVTGQIREAEYVNALRRYRISAILLAERWGAADKLEAVQNALSLPVALFDWTLGAIEETKEFGDALTLDPRLCDKRSAESVINWLSGLILEQKRPAPAVR
jgi:O-antigen biosynthesis protein